MAVAYRLKDEPGKRMYPLRYVAQMFMDQTLDDLRVNLQTQHVWPAEIYSNFRSINEIRKQRAKRAEAKGKTGPWYATGEGVKSFEGTVIEADENTGVVTLSIRYNDYMQYVDIGVGAGRKAEDVERGKKAKYKSRYTRWHPGSGLSHRPAIQPTLRHLATRLEDYCEDFYGKQFEYNIYETFEGLTIYI